jgi:dihydrofolate reductase
LLIVTASFRQVVVFIAMSLDGYIAGPDDNIDFLSAVDRPGEDYGYEEFIKTVDTVVMGRRTYDKVLTFGVEFPHRGRKCYVLSRTHNGSNPDVEFYGGDVSALVQELRGTPGKDIFVDGGSQVVFEMMNNDLIDRMVISIIPIVLGGGIPLFAAGLRPRGLHLIRSQAFPSGLVQLRYTRRPPQGAVPPM